MVKGWRTLAAGLCLLLTPPLPVACILLGNCTPESSDHWILTSETSLPYTSALRVQATEEF